MRGLRGLGFTGFRVEGVQGLGGLGFSGFRGFWGQGLGSKGLPKVITTLSRG